jgi:hypothetical protein
VNAGRHWPEPRVDKSLIVAAQGHGNRLAKANIDQTAIKMQRVPRVLHPEGNTFQESLSFQQRYEFEKYWLNESMAFKMKKMRSQEKKVLHMALFSCVPLDIVCQGKRRPGPGVPDHWCGERSFVRFIEIFCG